MSASVPASMKHCATCIYWSGERKLNQFTHHAEIVDSNRVALCTCKKQFGGTAKFGAYGKCSNYEEHPGVK